MNKVGIIGVGFVGEYYVKRFVDSGYPIIVYDIIHAKCVKAANQGATIAENNVDVTKKSDFIILALPDDETTEAVMINEVLTVIEKDQVIIDTGTNRPKTANKLEKLCREKGAHFLDSPLTWRGPGKTHILMVGGREESFKKAEEILKVMSYKYKLFGAPGAGQVIKLINQAILANQLAIYAEAVELTKKHGYDPNILKDYLDFPIREEFLTENHQGGGELILHYKDLGYLFEMAHESLANIPITNLSHEMLKSSRVYAEKEPLWKDTSIQLYFKRLNNDKL